MQLLLRAVARNRSILKSQNNYQNQFHKISYCQLELDIGKIVSVNHQRQIEMKVQNFQNILLSLTLRIVTILEAGFFCETLILNTELSYRHRNLFAIFRQVDSEYTLSFITEIEKIGTW
jgi:hypothetical protein